MAPGRTHSRFVFSVAFAAAVFTSAPAVPAVTMKEYTIGAGNYCFDFVFFSDFHVAEGKKLVDGLDDFGSPGYDDVEDDRLETTPAIEGDIACVDYIDQRLIGQPGYDVRFVVAGGDFTSSSERSEWQRARAVLGGLDQRPFFVPLVGNHDLWPYVGHGLSFYPPFPGYFEEQPEDEVVIGQYFIDAFGGVYDTLRCFQPAADWGESQWLLTPTESTNHRWPSYYNNFAFSYQGCRFIATDFNTRKDPPPSERPGLRGEPDVYFDQPFHWTLDWLKEQVAAVRPGERIICLGHQPYDQEYTNFQTDELRIISDMGLRNNKPIATSIGGHIHPFGDKPGRQLFGSDTGWDYYRPNAAKDGNVYVFHVHDSIRLRVSHSRVKSGSPPAVQLEGALDYDGGGNAPVGFAWDFGDAAPVESAGTSVSHEFPAVADDTIYKVSLRVTTTSGRRIWACDTVHVAGLHVARTSAAPRQPALAASAVSVSPNPLRAGVAVMRYRLVRPGPAALSVRDVTGRAVRRQELNLRSSGSVCLDLGDLRAGVYLVEVKADRLAARQKLVVQR